MRARTLTLAVLLQGLPAGAQVLVVPAGDSAPVLAQPEATSPSGRLTPAAAAAVECRTETEPRFYRVRLPSGEIGYVAAHDVRLVAGPASTASPTLVAGPFRYVGTSNCVVCHRHEHRLRDSDPHPRALAGLRGKRARDEAEARGIGEPDQVPGCRRCHVTAHGAAPEQLATSFDGARESVGCEACHGPGSGYADPRVHAVSRKRAIERGMTDLSTLEAQDSLCRRCHNPESPTYKRFDLQTFGETIRHWPRPDDRDWRRFFAAVTSSLPVSGETTPAHPIPPPDIPICRPGPAAEMSAPPPPPPLPPEASEPATVLLDRDPPGKFGPVSFPHRKHAREHQPAHSCSDTGCHHLIPTYGGRPPRTTQCHACHPRDEPSAEGSQVKAEAAYHKACVVCHAAAGKGPQKLMPCSGCHGQR